MARVAATALAAVLLAQPAAAAPSAEQKETARNLMQIGDGKFTAGDHAGALEAYEAADAIMQVPTTGLAVGRARARLGRLVEAVDALQRAARHPESQGEPKAFAAARAEAKKLDADVARRIPTLKVMVKGPAADTPIDVTIDGAAVPAELPHRVNPGTHVVSAKAPGYHAAEKNTEIAEQQHEAIELTLEPGPAAPEPRAAKPAASTFGSDDAASPLMIAGFAVGGVGLVVGIATGVVSLVRTQELEDRCAGTTCPESAQADHDDILVLANVSNVAFAVGGLGIAAGMVGLVLELQDDDRGIEAVLGPGAVNIRGRF